MRAVPIIRVSRPCFFRTEFRAISISRLESRLDSHRRASIAVTPLLLSPCSLPLPLSLCAADVVPASSALALLTAAAAAAAAVTAFASRRRREWSVNGRLRSALPNICPPPPPEISTADICPLDRVRVYSYRLLFMVTDVVIRVRFTITWVMSRVLVFREGLGCQG